MPPQSLRSLRDVTHKIETLSIDKSTPQSLKWFPVFLETSDDMTARLADKA